MRALLAAALLLAACGKRAPESYKRCLALRLGMDRESMLAAMGSPDSVSPYVEGRSLPHLKGLTAYEWENPASLPGPNYVSVEDATGRVRSVRCSDVVISAGLEPR